VQLPWDHDPRGDRTSCKRQVSGSNPLTGSTFSGTCEPSHLQVHVEERNVVAGSRLLDTEIPTKPTTAQSRSAYAAASGSRRDCRELTMASRPRTDLGRGTVLDGGRAASCQGRFDEGAGEFFEVMAGGIGDVAQGPLPGEYG
jgi:hypothetical protein